MALPKQVRQQIADAKRIEDEIRAEQAAPQPSDVEPTPPAHVEPATPPLEAAPAPTPAPIPDDQYAQLLQQHRSLQGIHRALVQTNGTLQSQVQTLQASIQQLTDEVHQLRQVPPTPPVSKITDAEITEFGPDLISVIERKAQEIVAPLNVKLATAEENARALAARNAELERSLNSVQQMQDTVARETFAAQLTRLVPDFNVLNTDQNFLAWLMQVNPLDTHRMTLQAQLDEAVQAGDAQTVAGFFNTFKQQVARTPAPTPKPKPDLAAQAQPTTRGGPDITPTPEGRQWASADISQFYADVARGKYPPQDKVRIEKEIFAAQTAGRIAA